MDFYLQFAHNMQLVCCELITEWKGGTVIMSPRDCKPADEEKDRPDQLEKHAASIQAAGGTILVDPQFYLPDCDHKTLISHDYWPESYDSGEFWKEKAPDYGELIKRLGVLNATLKTPAMIVPGTLAGGVNNEWLGRQSILVNEARKQFGDRQLYATVALSADSVKSADQIHAVLEAVAGWKVEGVYLICEHPDNQYIVANDEWVLNILDLAAGIRLRGRKVIIGYANQQMLIAACSSATAIAAGSHKMKRQFSPSTLMEKEDDDVVQQATWYYCPQAYSEFKIARLDAANLQKILHKLKYPDGLGVAHAKILFEGAQPTTVGFKHKLSFKHYLGCLHAQALGARKATFNETVKAYRDSLDVANALLDELALKRVRAEERSFLPAIDPAHVALNILEEDRGAVLRRAWGKI